MRLEGAGEAANPHRQTPNPEAACDRRNHDRQWSRFRKVLCPLGGFEVLTGPQLWRSAQGDLLFVAETRAARAVTGDFCVSTPSGSLSVRTGRLPYPSLPSSTMMSSFASRGCSSSRYAQSSYYDYPCRDWLTQTSQGIPYGPWNSSHTTKIRLESNPVKHPEARYGDWPQRSGRHRGKQGWGYYTILYYTILYYTILYYTIIYYTMLRYTILYYTIL